MCYDIRNDLSVSNRKDMVIVLIKVLFYTNKKSFKCNTWWETIVIIICERRFKKIINIKYSRKLTNSEFFKIQIPFSIVTEILLHFIEISLISFCRKRDSFLFDMVKLKSIEFF